MTQNICIGIGAGRYFREGCRNILIGHNAGHKFQKGSNNIIIGDNIPGDVEMNDQIIINLEGFNVDFYNESDDVDQIRLAIMKYVRTIVQLNTVVTCSNWYGDGEKIIEGRDNILIGGLSNRSILRTNGSVMIGFNLNPVDMKDGQLIVGRFILH